MFVITGFVVCWLLFGVDASSDTPSSRAIRQLNTLEKILSHKSYDAHFPPNFDSDEPVMVAVQMMITSIDSVRESSMDYSLTIFLRQFWEDNRLRYDGNITAPKNASNLDISKQVLELNPELMKKIWVPDTYFDNEREASTHDVTVPNKLMHIYPNGTVIYSMRISMTLTCHMKLMKYPFDEQRCPLLIGSYGLTWNVLRYKWMDRRPLQVQKNVVLPTFSITSWNLEDCQEQVYDTGTFSCIRLSVLLSRSYGYYITQVYLPSMLIVILSWVSFWLDIDAIPARISLGLLTVLTMTTMGVGARSELPKVSYVKALDLWMAICLLFVFAALLEFAYVNVNTRVEKRRMSMRDAVKMATAAANLDVSRKTDKPLLQPQQNTQQRRARRIDKLSRFIFPGVFLAFNVFYWTFYMFL